MTDGTKQQDQPAQTDDNDRMRLIQIAALRTEVADAWRITTHWRLRAETAEARVRELEALLRDVTAQFRPTWEISPEGRFFLRRVDAAIAAADRSPR